MGSMTRCWKSLREGRSWFGNVVTAKEPWQISSGRVTLRWKDHEEGSKRVVGRCKEMDRAELEIDVERARGSCGLEKASQS